MITEGSVTLSDNGFSTVVPPLQSGLFMLTIVNSAAGVQGIFSVSVASGGASCVKVTVAADLEATTGVLNGTTGTDAKFTLSAHTDGKLYLENRLGSSKEIHWKLFT